MSLRETTAVYVIVVLLILFYNQGFNHIFLHNRSSNVRLLTANFVIELDNVNAESYVLAKDADIRICHKSQCRSPAAKLDDIKYIWQSMRKPFVMTAMVNETVGPGNGEYRIEETVFRQTTSHTVRFDVDNSDAVRGFIFFGDLMFESAVVGNFSLTVREVAADRVDIKVSLKTTSRDYDRTILSYHRHSDELIYGLGEQFSHYQFNGLRVPILTREQGIGRGRQPITYILNHMRDKEKQETYTGGDSLCSYSAIGHYMTSRSNSAFLHYSHLAFFDFTNATRTNIEVVARQAHVSLFYAETPFQLISSYTKHISGRMKPPPEWAHRDGAVVGIQGGERKVIDIVEKLKRNNVSVAAVWLQDWVGTREQTLDISLPFPLLIPGIPRRDGIVNINVTFSNPQLRLWWNWENDRVLYPNWKEMTQRLNSEYGVKVLAYVNPFFTDVVSGGKPRESYTVSYYEEAKRKGFLVRQWKKNEKNQWEVCDYIFSSGPGISAGLIDLWNPEARQWFKDIIRTNLIDAGISGWMADFGEYLPFDAYFYLNRDGPPPSENGLHHAALRFHNMYPLEWALFNEEVANENKSRDLMIFLRSISPQSPGHANSFWQGDQLHTWDNLDGLESTVLAQLSSSISGVAFTHSDIGGYTTLNIDSRVKVSVGGKVFSVKVPILENRARLIRKEPELLERWLETASLMSTSLFRTHEGSAPMDNIQVWDDERLMKKFGFYTDLFTSLYSYRSALSEEYSKFGYAPVRHMFMHYPGGDRSVWSPERIQYMFGPLLLVVPITTPGIRRLNQNITDIPLDQDPDIGDTFTRLWNDKVSPKGIIAAKELPKPLHGRPYLPKGRWLHISSGIKFEAGQGGLYLNPADSRFSLPATPGKPAVFLRLFSKEEIEALIVKGMYNVDNFEDWAYWLDRKSYRFPRRAVADAWKKYERLQLSLEPFLNFMYVKRYPE